MTHICSSSHAGCLLVRASLPPSLPPSVIVGASLPPSLLPAEGNLIYQVKVVPSRAAEQQRRCGGGEMRELSRSAYYICTSTPHVLHTSLTHGRYGDTQHQRMEVHISTRNIYARGLFVPCHNAMPPPTLEISSS